MTLILVTHMVAPCIIGGSWSSLSGLKLGFRLKFWELLPRETQKIILRKRSHNTHGTTLNAKLRKLGEGTGGGKGREQQG